MEIKGILFDKDGTLIDFYEVWGHAVLPVMRKILKQYDLEQNAALLEQILIRIGVYGDVIDPEGSFAWKSFEMIAVEIAEEMAMYSTQKPVDEKVLKDQLTTYFYQEIHERCEVFPTFTNLPMLMDQLEKMGIQIGLATTDEEKATKECMKRLGIEKQISFYGTAGGTMPEKPDKELLFRAAAFWNIHPEEIVVVGDTPNDMRFAQNAGAIGIGVLSGTGRKKDLLEYTGYIVDSVDYLIPMLKSITKSAQKEEKIEERK